MEGWREAEIPVLSVLRRQPRFRSWGRAYERLGYGQEGLAGSVYPEKHHCADHLSGRIPGLPCVHFPFDTPPGRHPAKGDLKMGAPYYHLWIRAWRCGVALLVDLAEVYGRRRCSALGGAG